MADPTIQLSEAMTGPMDITITQVFSPSNIWAIPSYISQNCRFMRIKKQMVAACTQQIHQLKMRTTVRQGEVYVYHPAATDRWYRVRVLACFRRTTGVFCQVRLLDDGELQTVAEAELYALPEPYCDLNQLPAQAFRVRLRGLTPIEMTHGVSDDGQIFSAMTAARRWSEAACALVRRLLSPGTLCRLETSRVDRRGVRHGSVTLLGSAQPDLALSLVGERLARRKTDAEESSSEEEQSELAVEASLRQREVLDSDDSEPHGAENAGRVGWEGPQDCPRRPSPEYAQAADKATFLSEKRKMEEQFRHLTQQNLIVDPERENQRLQLQRSLAGLLAPDTSQSTSQAAGPGNKPSDSCPEVAAGSHRVPLGRGGGTVCAESDRPARGRAARLLALQRDGAASPAGGPASGTPPSDSSPSPAARPSSGSPSPASSGSGGGASPAASLSEALRQLRSDPGSSDEARRPAAVLLPAGHTSTARHAALRRAEDERRRQETERRLRRRSAAGGRDEDRGAGGDRVAPPHTPSPGRERPVSAGSSPLAAGGEPTPFGVVNSVSPTSRRCEVPVDRRTSTSPAGRPLECPSSVQRSALSSPQKDVAVENGPVRPQPAPGQRRDPVTHRERSPPPPQRDGEPGGRPPAAPQDGPTPPPPGLGQRRGARFVRVSAADWRERLLGHKASKPMVQSAVPSDQTAAAARLGSGGVAAGAAAATRGPASGPPTPSAGEPAATAALPSGGGADAQAEGSGAPAPPGVLWGGLGAQTPSMRASPIDAVPPDTRGPPREATDATVSPCPPLDTDRPAPPPPPGAPRPVVSGGPQPAGSPTAGGNVSARVSGGPQPAGSPAAGGDVSARVSGGPQPAVSPVPVGGGGPPSSPADAAGQQAVKRCPAGRQDTVVGRMRRLMRQRERATQPTGQLPGAGAPPPAAKLTPDESAGVSPERISQSVAVAEPAAAVSAEQTSLPPVVGSTAATGRPASSDPLPAGVVSPPAGTGGGLTGSRRSQLMRLLELKRRRAAAADASQSAPVTVGVDRGTTVTQDVGRVCAEGGLAPVGQTAPTAPPPPGGQGRTGESAPARPAQTPPTEEKGAIYQNPVQDARTHVQAEVAQAVEPEPASGVTEVDLELSAPKAEMPPVMDVDVVSPVAQTKEPPAVDRGEVSPVVKTEASAAYENEVPAVVRTIVHPAVGEIQTGLPIEVDLVEVSPVAHTKEPCAVDVGRASPVLQTELPAVVDMGEVPLIPTVVPPVAEVGAVQPAVLPDPVRAPGLVAEDGVDRARTAVPDEERSVASTSVSCSAVTAATAAYSSAVSVASSAGAPPASVAVSRVTATATAPATPVAPSPAGPQLQRRSQLADLSDDSDGDPAAPAGTTCPPAPAPVPSAPRRRRLTSGKCVTERPPAAGDEAQLRVLVNGRRKVAPYWRTEQMPFVDMIRQKLRPLSFSPSRVQAYLWSAVARYRSAICVSPPGSGKTLGYLLAVVNGLLDESAYSELPAGHGPKCLVLVPSWRRGRAIQELCLELTDSLRCQPLLVHGGGAEQEQEVALMNGCDLLVGTPACLLRLMQRGGDSFVQLKRVCHLVLDDADVLVEHFNEQVDRLLVAVFSLWRGRTDQTAALPQQVVVTARHWTDGLVALTSQLQDSLAVTSCYLEQLVWAGPRIFTHVLDETQKDAKLIGLLVSGLHRQRLVVFTCSDRGAQRLAALLQSQSYSVLLADGDQLGASLTELERCWWSSSGAHDILVVSDTVVAELAVRDAGALVHYDVPTEKRTQLGLRCSYMMDNYPDRLTQPETENTCVVHVLVSPSDADVIGLRLEQLLGRLGAAVPAQLAEAARRQRRSGGCGLQLCAELLAAGRCRDRLSCEKRHWLHPAVDAGHPDIPQYGEVTVSVCHVLDAATLAVRLLSVRQHDLDTGASSVRQLDGAFRALESNVCSHYDDPRNRVCHELPQLGDWCGLQRDGTFVRVQVTSLDSGPASCRVLLADFGSTETVPRSRLLSLPTALASVPPQAITVHLCGVRPVDGDAEWTDGATQLTRDHLQGQLAVGKVVLALDRRLWLSPLVRRRQHQLRQGSATLLDPSLASQLLERGFGQRAPDHLASLYRLCERAGLPLRDQWKPADRRKLYQTEYLPLVAPLKNNSSVNITSVVSPQEFYVQRNDVFKQYEQLMEELNIWADSPAACRLPLYRHRVKQHCVAKFEDDGRWYRARVLSVTTDEAADRVTYELLYTDVGDTASVDEQHVLPLLEKFAKRLPLQAIRCELAFCQPAAEEGDWSEEAGDALYQMSLDDQQLWVPFHCQLISHDRGVHRVLLYNPERTSVAALLAGAGLARLDQQALEEAEPPLFPVDRSARSLDSDDSDSESDSERRLAETQTALSYPDVLKMAPKVDGVPVMEIGDFEVVGFPFSRFSRDGNRAPSSTDSIEVIGPECADIPVASEPPPPPVDITELDEDHAGPPPPAAHLSDDDWERVAPHKSPEPPLPPPLVLPSEKSGPMVRVPRVTWWQDGSYVRLYIHLSDVRQPDVVIKPGSFSFKCMQSDCQFAVAVALYSTVRPEDSSYQALGARVQVKLRKERALSWRRLTSTPLKARWLHHDLEHLGEDGSSSEDTFRAVAAAAAPPAPIEAQRVFRRGRPVPAEPAAGGGTSSSSDSGDDMELGLGGGAELLEDPAALRELLAPDPWAAADMAETSGASGRVTAD